MSENSIYLKFKVASQGKVSEDRSRSNTTLQRPDPRLLTAFNAVPRGSRMPFTFSKFEYLDITGTASSRHPFPLGTYSVIRTEMSIDSGRLEASSLDGAADRANLARAGAQSATSQSDLCAKPRKLIFQ